MHHGGLATRVAKTVVYFPFEVEHSERSGAVAWLIILICVVLGIVVSFENIFLGVALAVFCLHGSALLKYLATR